jgi:hypothetical protein
MPEKTSCQGELGQFAELSLELPLLIPISFDINQKFIIS